MTENVKITQKNRKVRKNLGLSFIIAGAVFLSNPDLVILDVLPDFIGYFFIMAGLSQIADLSDELTDAVKHFKRLFVLSIVQLCCVFFLYGGALNANEQPMSSLMFTFVFLVLNLWFGFPAWKKFFDGFLYLGMRQNGESVMAGRKGKGGNVTVSLQYFTYFFLVFRMAFPLLAEWSVLSMYDAMDNPQVFNYYTFISTWRFWAVLAGLAIGVLWLVAMIRYVLKICRDEPFMTALTHKYEQEILPREGLFITRRIKTGFFILSIAAGLSFEFFLDNSNFMPEFVFPLVAAAALIVLRPYIDRTVPPFITLGLCAASGIVLRVLTSDFYARYLSLMYLDEAEGARAAYNVLCGLTLLHEALLFVSFLLIVRSLRRLIEEQTGIILSGHDPSRQTQEMKNVCRFHLNSSLVPCLLTAVAGFLYRLLLPIYVYTNYFQLLLFVIFLIWFVTGLNRFSGHVATRYDLDTES